MKKLVTKCAVEVAPDTSDCMVQHVILQCKFGKKLHSQYLLNPGGAITFVVYNPAAALFMKVVRKPDPPKKRGRPFKKFTVGDKDYHEANNLKCSACWPGYPVRCKCGGLIHAAYGDEDYDGDFYLVTLCSKCGSTE
jgi:hypothetical protein